MFRPVHWIITATSSLALLAGCASNAPAPPASPTAGPNAKPLDLGDTVPGRPDSTLKAQAGYRVVTRKGEVLYCKREIVTGSRTNAAETCLTAAQLEKQRNGSEALMRSLQDMNNGRPEDRGYNNAMGPGRRD